MNATAAHWKRSYGNDAASDRLTRKVSQAEALAMCLYAEAGAGFRVLNDGIQDTVHWLMADMLTDIRELIEEREKESWHRDRPSKEELLKELADRMERNLKAMGRKKRRRSATPKTAKHRKKKAAPSANSTAA